MKIKTTTWFQLIFLIAIFSIGIGYSIYKKRVLNDCFTIMNAVVVKKYRQKKRGTYIQYKYTVDGKEYFSTENSSIKKGTDKIYLGDTTRIKISCSNPNVSEIFKE